jgi:hypothetical protein
LRARRLYRDLNAETTEMPMSAKIEQLRMMRAKAVCSLIGGIDVRTLFEHVKAGHFPPPDRQGGSGRPNLWHQVTVERGLKSYARMTARAPDQRRPRVAVSA